MHLTNGLVRVVAVPDIGGRLMAYDLDRHQYLFVDRHLAGKLFTAAENQGDGSLAAWKNYGGAKTWPAPQGWDGPDQWPGPPDPILDTGRYEVAELIATADEARLRMVSPTGSPTGVRITREVTLRCRLQPRRFAPQLHQHLGPLDSLEHLGCRPTRRGAGRSKLLANLGPALRHHRAGQPALPVSKRVHRHVRRGR